MTPTTDHRRSFPRWAQLTTGHASHAGPGAHHPKTKLAISANRPHPPSNDGDSRKTLSKSIQTVTRPMVKMSPPTGYVAIVVIPNYSSGEIPHPNLCSKVIVPNVMIKPIRYTPTVHLHTAAVIVDKRGPMVRHISISMGLD
jgi:hypothetical protein